VTGTDFTCETEEFTSAETEGQQQETASPRVFFLILALFCLVIGCIAVIGGLLDNDDIVIPGLGLIIIGILCIIIWVLMGL